MKNITIKSLTAVALLASLFSCSDFLDQSSPSSLDGKKFSVLMNMHKAPLPISIRNLESKTIVHVPFGMDTIQI